ncbi:uncharacterized protein BDR25DRAFT_349476 [Lindgomyces ingoldianus]|uniref:Uncharacterized protein n=1 Tax=Lindgomyces ingoldianus TaxID=673940 RepID=A0ACB6RB45_9PLEO|nr:uncharacterized protein BDR25DRAFT_349476 [Lindgomyces ingoldianus]KAF2476366.1 hypothetical protein BDR25DRAFT_349476 [Lindgomyces ingoldianus]
MLSSRLVFYMRALRVAADALYLGISAHVSSNNLRITIHGDARTGGYVAACRPCIFVISASSDVRRELRTHKPCILLLQIEYGLGVSSF